MQLEEKKNIVRLLHEKFLKSSIIIATDYKGLNVETMNVLRKKLRAEGVEYQVVKNTLLIRSTQDTVFAEMNDWFKGPTAIALTEGDPVVPAKILTEFAKDNDKLDIKAAFLKAGESGKVLDMNGIKSLSSLPSREVLLGQLLSAMNGVPTGLVRTLNGIPGKLMNVLQAVSQKKEAETA